MKIAVVGSRDYPDLGQVSDFIKKIASKYPDATIVSGGAKGVDTTAQLMAEALNLSTEIFLPDWEAFGRSAGYKRNVQIVEAAEVVVAFQFNGSRGTQHTIEIARKAGKRVYVYTP
jgi:predicted Rossmann fold nucleotide-binding protein DprA/Smf involved in DNA uptake